MIKAIVIFAVVCAFIVGTLLTLRSKAKTGMPSKDVLERATRRARELDARDEADK
ncbi:MAG: DUF2897 family protein [Gammaproteobacteria bacterium]